MTAKRKILVLYSGGLDSYILYHYAKVSNPDAEVLALYWKHGQPAMWKELERLPSFVEVKNIDWLDEKNLPVPMKSKPNEGAIFIPGRNMVFITTAACQYLPNEIWMGSVANEVSAASTDKNEEFCRRLEPVLNYVLQDFIDQPIKVRIPFVENGWGKREAIVWALDNGMSKQEIANTTSCYHATDLACGNCIQCLRRWAIFKFLGIHEEYVKWPPNSPFAIETYKELLKTKKAAFYYDEIVPAVKAVLQDEPYRLSSDAKELISKL